MYMDGVWEDDEHAFWQILIIILSIFLSVYIKQKTAVIYIIHESL